MNEKYERQMKKGVLDMLVLRLLEREAMYGYHLIQEMAQLSQGVFALKEGTLYPVLYRLEDEALAESRWTDAQGKQIPRKYYQITDKGKAVLEEMYGIWQQISTGIGRIMED